MMNAVRTNGSEMDPIAWNLWHPISGTAEITVGVVYETTLLEVQVSYTRTADGVPVVWRSVPELPRGARVDPSSITEPLPVIDRYCFTWTCLGTPADELFSIPQFDEPDRRSVASGSFGVHTSAPRAVENFLDMGHFPYVHSGILGILPHTEVADYDVEVTKDPSEVVATRCRFYQPMAAATATGGQMTDYIYRVPHPYVAILYKTSPPDPTRMDAIALFLQPMTQERVRAHNFLCMLDDVSDDSSLKAFQQLIFGQDKPILENQFPRRLPLAPRAETPIRADKTAIAYRRWLTDLGLTYGVIPAAA
jgi:phenylpropionate dioxygenase-like ring-hydroxylating dioxygenase large terminal subunit